MSVQSEIDRIITAVGNAYSKVSEKGGTVPASQTVANLATAIDSIPAGGGTPSLQSKSVTYTSNGTYIMEPDYGYDGLSRVGVTVDVASGGGGSDYVDIYLYNRTTSDFLVQYSTDPIQTDTVYLMPGDTNNISAYRPGSIENAIEILPAKGR